MVDTNNLDLTVGQFSLTFPKGNLNLRFKSIVTASLATSGSRARSFRGCIRQRLGPTKKRLQDRINQTQVFLQQQVTLDESEGKVNELLLKLERNLKSSKDLLEQLQEASKDDEAKTQRLEGEMEEFSILVLDGDEAICDLKIILADIAKRKQETT